MYLEEYENRGYPIKGFIFKMILIILLFLLFLVIVSKISFKENEVINYDDLFKDNLEYIKDSAINYYSASKLPNNQSESEIMTLDEMIKKNIINNIDDLNVNDSYVSITKLAEDYLLKIYLKNNSDSEDYYLYHLNSYPYCESYICPKEASYEFINYGVNAVIPFNENEAPKPIEPMPEAVTSPLCNIINNRYFDSNGKQVSEVDYIINCQNPKCQIVDGYYFGKDGKSLSKTKFIKECASTFKCIELDGVYYDGKGNKVSKKAFEKDCSNELQYSYEYIKKTNVSFSDWSDWSSWERVDCSTQEVMCDNNDTECVFKLQKLVKKEKNGVYQKTYSKKRYILTKTSSYKKKACANYNYIKIDGKLYATPKNSNYESFINLKKDTNNSDWAYVGNVFSKDLNNKSLLDYYSYISADFSNCSDTCTTSPNYIYDAFKYIGGIAEVDSLTSSSDVNGVLLHEIYENGQSNKFSTQCGSFKEKTISVYEFKAITDKDYRDEPLYGDVCYKSIKTRDKIGAGSTRTIWSSLNDSKLLKDGWIMTGKTKKV